MKYSAVSLGDVASIVSGSGFPTKYQGSKSGDIPFGKVGDISAAKERGSNIITTARNYVSKQQASELRATIFPENTIVFAKIGEAIRGNRRAITGVSMAFDNNVMGVTPDARVVDAAYIYHFLETKDFYQIANATSVPSIRKTALASIQVPLPTLAEQKRIAAILEKADELYHLRRRSVERLNDLGQAIFHEMFGNFKNTANLGDLIDRIEGGKNLVASDASLDSAYRVLKISAIGRQGFNPSETKPLPADYVPPASHLVKRGDLLLSRANTAELVGLAAIVEDIPSNVALPDKLWRLVPDEAAACPRFLEQLFRQPMVRSELARMCSGTSGSMKNISMSKLVSIEVPRPPIDLQLRFQDRYEELTSLRANARRQAATVSTLFSSLQHRAFSGVL